MSSFCSIVPVVVDRLRRCRDPRRRSRQQGSELPGRPAEGGGDHRCHARGRGPRARSPPARADRDHWRAGLRIQEALALTEGDLDQRRGSLLVRRGKGGRRREVGMDTWGWEQLRPGWSSGANSRSVRSSASSTARRADATGRRRGTRRAASRGGRGGVRRRFAPHQLRHAHAVEMAREGVPLNVIQRQLGHSNLGITQRLPAGHRQRRDHRAVHARRAPMIPVNVSLRL